MCLFRAVSRHCKMASEVCNAKFARIVIMSISFTLIFTAFQTSSMAEQSVIDGAKNEPNSTFTGDGFISLATIYAVFAASNWGAPSVVSLLGPTVSMIVGTVPYALFIASFLKPMTWTLYTGSALVGLGASVLWTAQGNYLSINSDSDTITRNSGVFWALFQCSLLIGNLYVYIAFRGDININKDMRTTFYTILSSVCLAGLVLLFFLFCLRSRPSTDDEVVITEEVRRESTISLQAESEGATESEEQHGMIHAFKNSVRLLATKQMILLCFSFAYTGLHMTFFSGVYGTCVGHTLHFGTNVKSYIGFCGIFIGVGEITGGLAFGIFGKRTNRYGRDPIILLGFIVNTVCYYLIYINLPEDSPFENTFSEAFLESNVVVAVVCAFLLGFGDSCYNTQIYSLLGDIYKDESAEAFALFKFMQSLTAAAAFFYSSHIILVWQLLILTVTNFLALVTFVPVEWSNIRPVGYEKIQCMTSET